MTATLERESVLATTKAREQAATLVSDLSDSATEVELRDGRTIPPELTALLQRVLRAVASGRTVTVGTLPDELTTSVAAEMLSISRPTLMKLVRDGVIPSHKVGTHTRILTTDVLAFRRARLEKQRQAFEALRVLEDELGLD